MSVLHGCHADIFSLILLTKWPSSRDTKTSRPNQPNERNTQKKVYVETYGCQMNLADTEVVLSVLAGAGYSEDQVLTEADVIFVNTCAIARTPKPGCTAGWETSTPTRRQPRRSWSAVLGCMAERLRKDLMEVGASCRPRGRS